MIYLSLFNSLLSQLQKHIWLFLTFYLPYKLLFITSRFILTDYGIFIVLLLLITIGLILQHLQILSAGTSRDDVLLLGIEVLIILNALLNIDILIQFYLLLEDVGVNEVCIELVNFILVESSELLVVIDLLVIVVALEQLVDDVAVPVRVIFIHVWAGVPDRLVLVVVQHVYSLLCNLVIKINIKFNLTTYRIPLFPVAF